VNAVKKMSTRNRAVVSVFVLGMVMFFFSSPISKWAYELVTVPSTIKNINVVQKNFEVEVSWDRAGEHDVSYYELCLDGRNKVSLEVEVTNYLFTELENGHKYKIEINAVDHSDKKSDVILFYVTPSEGWIESFTENIDGSDDSIFSFIAYNSAIVFVIIFLFNLWILFFKVKGMRIVTVVLFPSVAIVPFLFLGFATLFLINTDVYKIIFSGVISVISMILVYLMILTSNILNAAVQSQLPLEQAGKAAQFIFSLISTYLLLIVVYGTNFNILVRLLLVVPFVFYFSYSCIWMLRGVGKQQVLLRALSITMVIILTVVVLSVWPISSIYAMLSGAVIYYVILSIALELRSNLSRRIWIEYIVLFGLIFFLLTTNSNWGLNGTLI